MIDLHPMGNEVSVGELALAILPLETAARVGSNVVADLDCSCDRSRNEFHSAPLLDGWQGKAHCDFIGQGK